VSRKKLVPKGQSYFKFLRHRVTYFIASEIRKLGGQALVLDVEGTWRELTGVVNKLAANLTSQVIPVAHDMNISSLYVRFDQ
jgi:hypothetical protein